MKIHWPFTTKKKMNAEVTQAAQRGRVLGKFDAAQTTSENATHWSMTDALSADGGYSLAVRKRLRERARYEVGNNSYAKGMVLTLANDIIGTGPRLQIIDEDNKLSARIEMEFAQWSEAIGLAAKLRTMQMSKITDGEVFAILKNNPETNHLIQLDVGLVECDRITNPFMGFENEKNNVDGKIFDEFGNPKAYQLALRHPGDVGIWEEDFDTILASNMIHYFRVDRPGQSRGISEITPALPLFGQLRRYTLAVIASAETAADFAAVLYTKSPANGDAVESDPFESIELERRMATTLPSGWELGQVKAEQPVTNYPEFKKEILNEIARCMNIPFNVAAGNSAGYNYASGRLDHQTYFKSIHIEQAFLSTVVLDRIFHAWLMEAMLLNEFSFLRNRVPRNMIRHIWFFDGTEHVDPVKEAKGQEIELMNGSTNHAIICGGKGRDWEEVAEQRAKEKKKYKELGLIEEPVLQENGNA